MSNAKVSVLIPLYNAEKYIENTIQSVLDQTYSNIEIIIVNDGSTDNSLKIAQKYVSDRVHIYTQINSGPGKTRNRAFELSTGDYIQYLDADDLLEPNKIALQIEQTKFHSINTLYIGSIEEFNSSTSFRQKHNYKYFKNYTNPVEFLIDFWYIGGMLQMGALLIPRHLIDESGVWNESWILNEDGEFLCRLVEKCSEIIYTPDSLCYYRRDNIMSLNNSRSSKHYLSQFESYETYTQILTHFPENRRLKEALARQYSRFLYNIYVNFPELSLDVLKKINSLGYNKPLRIGSQKFQMLIKLIGTKNAVLLRNFVRQLSNNIKTRKNDLSN